MLMCWCVDVLMCYEVQSYWLTEGHAPWVPGWSATSPGPPRLGTGRRRPCIRGGSQTTCHQDNGSTRSHPWASEEQPVIFIPTLKTNLPWVSHSCSPVFTELSVNVQLINVPIGVFCLIVQPFSPPHALENRDLIVPFWSYSPFFSSPVLSAPVVTPKSCNQEQPMVDLRVC